MFREGGVNESASTLVFDLSLLTIKITNYYGKELRKN